MDSLRDWGHAKDYVKMQWMMLQQETPEDFVIATGVQYSVREFVRMAAEQVGIELAFEGEGVNEKGIVVSVNGTDAKVETLLGDPTNAHKKLGWSPEITLREMVKEMVSSDLAIAKKNVLLKANNIATNIPQE